MMPYNLFSIFKGLLKLGYAFSSYPDLPTKAQKGNRIALPVL